MSKYLTKSVAATISALLLLGCAAPAFAADATVEKKETSYLILNKATFPISRISRAT